MCAQPGQKRQQDISQRCRDREAQYPFGFFGLRAVNVHTASLAAQAIVFNECNGPVWVSFIGKRRFYVTSAICPECRLHSNMSHTGKSNRFKVGPTVGEYRKHDTADFDFFRQDR